MTITINGINSYYRNYAITPTNSTTLNPMANLLKISAASALFSNSYTKNYDPRLSAYFNLLTKNTYLLKAVTSSFQANNYDSSFSKRSVTTSDDSAINGTATQMATARDYTVNIKNIAEKQLNTGSKLASSGKASDVGLNSFVIKHDNGPSKNISFTISDTDTNKTALDKMAKAINSSSTYIKANVITDKKNGTSNLLLEGKTGTKNSFTLEDVKGNSVANTNANSITTEAKDAHVSIDGNEYTSEDNTVNLDNNKVVINLNKAEAKDIKVSVGVDKSAAKDALINIVDNYNNLINFSHQYSTEFSGANTLNKELGTIANSKKTSLGSIGITVNNDNTLTIDEKKLDKSLKDDFSKLRDVMSGYGEFSNKLDNKTNEILMNQYKYAKPLDINSNFNDISNYFSSSSKMPYLQNLSLGYIINTMV